MQTGCLMLFRLMNISIRVRSEATYKMSRFLIYVFVGFTCVIFSKNADAFGQFCEEAGIQFKKGETITIPGECTSFTCEEPGINLMIGKRCEEGKKECKTEPGNDKLDFPDCCPKVVCP